MRRVFGVDFSGAREAGNSIWIAAGHAQNGRLDIESCRPGRELPHSGAERETCLRALVRFVAGERKAVFGFDFPFGIPGQLFEEREWTAFVLGFPERHATAEDFRADCRRRTGGKEPKRGTDIEAKTPWAAFNLKLYRQTFYGIARVLCPLLREGAAVVLPMQRPREGRPWLIETCPASLLKREGVYPSYKGNSTSHRDRRRHILATLRRRGRLGPLDEGLRRLAIDNAGGDALDSILAALAAHRALPTLAGPRDAAEAREGRVYF